MKNENNAKLLASSLYALAAEEGLADIIYKELSDLREIFKKFPDYTKVLDSYRLSRTDAERMIDEDFKDSFHLYTKNFLKLMAKQHTLYLFGAAEREYSELFCRDNNIHTVEVTSARPLSEKMRAMLLEKLSKKYGAEVKLITKTDPKCIGGIILKADDMYIDQSVKSELEHMRRRMIGVE